MARQTFTRNLIDHPTLPELASGLKRWAERSPELLRIEERGRSVEGRPILLARVTDSLVADDDKQVVFLSAHHAGSEITGCTSLLHLTRWLLSDDPAADHLRKSLVILVMPVL
ncbi:MAG: M14 family zinc carboxypeptidase, partial [SAR202 cluster bacterium]|nr:M14 family zinc carboxypeptidase [SAR202 cluster bacterium]